MQEQQTQQNQIIQPGELYHILPDGRWEIYIDHSKLNAFMKCEQLFYYRHILHIAPRGFANWSMSWGHWWSAAMELCYKAIQNNSLNLTTVLDIGQHTWEAEKMDVLFPPSLSEDNKLFGGVRGVIQVLSEYYPTLVADSRTWKIIAAEAGFGRKKEVCIGENDKVVVYYIGKPDLLVSEFSSGRLLPIDHKSKDYIKSSLIKQFKPHAQTTGYIVVTEVLAKQLGVNVVVDRCIINLVGRKSPSDKPKAGTPKKERFTRVYPHYSQEELQEWKDNLVKKATRIRYCVENNEWLWKEDSCHLFSGCSFRDIDSVTVGSRQLMIDSKYVKVEPWIPYEVEE